MVLSLSLSGSLLILPLLLCRPLFREKLSKGWQHGIWLLVIARLLLPFSFGQNLIGTVFERLETGAAAPAVPAAPKAPLPFGQPDIPAEGENQLSPPNAPEAPAAPLPDAGLREGWGKVRGYAGQYLWAVWLGVAAVLLIQRITAYRSFWACVKAGKYEVFDPALLDKLAELGAQVGVRRPFELWVNPMVASPMLVGAARPKIVLPTTELSPEDFRYTVLHELAHYQRGDIFCKWLTQFTLCLHWFNPLVWLMAKEMDRACELACDEKVLKMLSPQERRAYGEMLLRAAGGYSGGMPVALNANAALLKERLGAIMSFKKSSKFTAALALLLTAALTLGAAAAGAYGWPNPSLPSSNWPSSADPNAAGLTHGQGESSNSKNSILKDDLDAQAAYYYEKNSLPVFQIIFGNLDEKAQGKWLDRIYTDGRIAFWGAAVGLLDEDCAFIQRYAEKTYADGSIAYFSALAMHMGEDTLKVWLNRALEDENTPFQSVLFNALGCYDEFNELTQKKEKEWAEAQQAEYEAVGVTMDGKDYYYQGQLVNIFLDIRPNKAFYTLDVNPKGVVHIKIVRNEDNKIIGVSYLTKAEITELFGEEDDLYGEDNLEMIPISLKTVAAGETIFLGEYTLSEGDQIWYDISAETGKRMQVFFTKAGQKEAAYWSVDNLRQPKEPLKCAADFTVGPPMTESGTYRLYLRAPDGVLGNVTGSVSIVFADDKP